MTRNDLLDALTTFTVEVTKDMLLPVKVQSSAETERPAAIYKMRLPDSKSAGKKAPYILHQIITGKDVQNDGEPLVSTVAIRSIFCVYCDDEQEGSLKLLELMERVRIGLLRKVLLEHRFQVDTKAGLETLVYPDDTAPYFCGEMMSNWIIPAVEREVAKWLV